MAGSRARHPRSACFAGADEDPKRPAKPPPAVGRASPGPRWSSCSARATFTPWRTRLPVPSRPGQAASATHQQDSTELVVELLERRIFTDDELAAQAIAELLTTRCLSIASGAPSIRNIASSGPSALARAAGLSLQGAVPCSPSTRGVVVRRQRSTALIAWWLRIEPNTLEGVLGAGELRVGRRRLGLGLELLPRSRGLRRVDRRSLRACSAGGCAAPRATRRPAVKALTKSSRCFAG